MASAPNPRPSRIPYDVAFEQIVRFVGRTIQETGEQWSAGERQAAACTIFIQAARDGILCRWEPPAQKSPAQCSKIDRGAIGDTLEDVLGASIIQARQRRNNADSGPQPVTPRPSEDAPAPAAAPNPSFSVMIRAFHEIEADLPPEVYAAVLEWHRVTRPEDFRPEQVKQAAACYVALKNARTQYRIDRQTTIEHFEATEDSWR